MSVTTRVCGVVLTLALLVGARVYSDGNQPAPGPATHAVVNAD
jgi:hypothetical protein